MRKIEKASSTIFLRELFEWLLTRPKTEMREKKTPAKVTIKYRFYIE